eukprot:TRINITY_DN6186_c0_g2_i1.p1 TRINITY_DN6186_c0_g2~~TRINITY_DN6186_c0_g2_i1.p1  ORF type:complete len:656 (+),score=72.59 TRINITY_DN6186_c0_g2_i1:74-2041(+)
MEVAFRSLSQKFPTGEAGPSSYETIVRRWLKSLNSHLNTDPVTELGLGTGSPFDDPLRSGTLLCQLVNFLEHVYALQAAAELPPTQQQQQAVAEGTALCVAYHRHPTTLVHVRENVSRALAALAAKNIPVVYTSQVEEILKGNSDVVWGLLYHVLVCFPLPEPIPTFIYFSPKFECYPPRLMRDLEVSVLSWVTSLSLIFETLPPADEKANPLSTPATIRQHAVCDPPPRITHPTVWPYLRNGTLLCDIATVATGKRILGVLRSPKTASSCLSNIRKATEALRSLKGMAKTYLDYDEDVYRGDKMVILALLEDVHRACDGVPARSRLIQRGDVPYVAVTCAKTPLPVPDTPDSLRSDIAPPNVATGRLRSASPSTSAVPSSPERRSSPKRPTNYAHIHEARRSPEPPQQPRYAEPTAARRASATVGSQAPQPAPVPRPLSARREVRSPVADPLNDALNFPVPIIGAGIPWPSRPSAFEKAKSGESNSRISPPKRPDVQQIECESVALSPSLLAQASTLVRWLAFIGIRPPPTLKGPRLQEFEDGTLLCRIAGTLMHCKLSGVEWKPKSKAARLHNIQKALEAFQGRHVEGVDELFLDLDIAEGKPEAVLQLLWNIKRANPCFISTTTKPLAPNNTGHPLLQLQGGRNAARHVILA